MSTLTALYDACVLYPMPLCDLLMQLALTDTYQAKWSDGIHEEWMRTTRTLRPDITEEMIQRKRAHMDANVCDALVTNYAQLIPSLALPDPDDRHVLAAAITTNADVIVTLNLRDFPIDTLQPWGIEAQHPDEFIAHLLDQHPGAVCWAVRTVRARLVNPPYSIEQYLATLQRQGLTKTVASLTDYADAL